MFVLLFSTLVSAQEAPPIVNGEETDAFPQVGSLMSLTNNGSGYDFCSGTLVHQNWVITAAHCVEAFDDNERYGYTNHFFVLGTDIYESSGIADYAEVVAWYHHPDYSTRTLDWDIGILQLGGSGITSVSPMPVNDDVPQNSWGEITYVGWGMTGDDDYRSTGIKRTVDIDIYYIDNNHVYTYDSDHNICSGDSGGAALTAVEGEYELIGANSFIFNINGGQPTCDGSGGGGASTRVDNALDWLEGYADLYRVGEIDDEPDDEPDDGDGGSGDGGSGDGGSGDGGGGGDGGGDGSGDTGIDYDTGDVGSGRQRPSEPRRPGEAGLVVATCSAAPGGSAPAGAAFALVLGLVGLRRRRY